MSKRNVSKVKIFTLFFSIIFIISLFSSINVFANDSLFKLIDAKIVDKSSNIEGDIIDYSNNKIKIM